MDCNEAQKLIVPYVKMKATSDEMVSLFKHVDECKECRDELEIYYILEHGLSEEHEELSFNLKEKFEKQIKEDKSYIEREKKIRIFSGFICSVSNIVLVISIIYFIIRYTF